VRDNTAFIRIWHIAALFWKSSSMKSVAYQAKPVVVSFSASDPTGGAGLQADLLTVAALGCQPATVLTGVTAQDSQGVHWFEALSSTQTLSQAQVLLADYTPAVFKAGALCSTDNIRVLAQLSAKYPQTPLIVDPVLASGRGDALVHADFIRCFNELLLPQVTVLTPNLPEALRLANTSDVAQAIDFFFARGVKAVLLTGTHDETTENEVINRLFLPDQGEQRYICLRLQGHYHGSGCTLASALSAFIARGCDFADAAQRAVTYTFVALQSATSPGRGQQIPDRLLGWSANLEEGLGSTHE